MPGSSRSNPTAVELQRELIEQSERLRHLERSEQRLRAFLESASQAVVAVDGSGAIVLVNAKTEELFGYSRAELLGASLEMLLPDRLRGQHASHRDGYFQAPRSRPMGVGMELSGRKKDGTTFPVEISLSLVKEPENEIALALITDITGRKRIEEQMRQSQKLESLGVLAGGIAHDFNNLLVGIIGNSSIALDQLMPSHPLHASIADVLSAAQRAADLTRQLLAYAGKGRFVVSLVDLSALIREITGLVRSSIPAGVQLRLELQEHLPFISADASQMQQLIMNLVINAAEAIGKDKEGIITVSTSVINVDAAYSATMLAGTSLDTGKYVTMEVQDTGVGMDDATMARIFDPFFTTKFTGRGLGLAAAVGIVHGHKGAMKVYTVLGRGSTFKVLLPVSGDAPPLKHPEPLHDLSGEGLVLVIDDEDVIRRTAKTALQRYGYTVLTAEDGQAGVDMFRELQKRVRMVVLDVTMPGMDGQETMRQLRLIDPSVSVLLSSGFNEVEAVRKFTGKGIAGFIQKPYTATQLAEKVKAALQGSPSQ